MTRTKQPILSICIPTYNRAAVLINNIKKYLSINESRFCINICDNASTDDTVKVLSEITDERISIHCNKENIGGPSNIMTSMQCSNAKYVLLILDKDTICIDFISQFIDALETYSPYWGMVNLYSEASLSPMTFKKGIEAIRNTGVYTPKHPSGFFVKRELYETFFKSDWQTIKGENLNFPLELCQLYFALRYDMMVINIPLIKTESIQVAKTVKSYSYNQQNCWFLYGAREMYYRTMLVRILASELGIDEKKIIITEMTNITLKNVGVTLRTWLEDPRICEHYYLQTRTISAYEMTDNMAHIMNVYKQNTKKYNYFDKRFYILSYIRIFKRFVKTYVKDIYSLFKLRSK